VYLEQVQSLGHAIHRGASKKLLRKDKLLGEPLFAYDESKRMLAVSVKRQVCCSVSFSKLNRSCNLISCTCLCSMSDTRLCWASAA
jgi:hypothetical protein